MMTRSRFSSCCLGLLAVGVAFAADRSRADVDKLPPAAAGPMDFARDVRPILTRSCVPCHGPDKQKGGLRLDRGAEALKGGNSGPVIVRGDAGRSRLLFAVTGLDPDLKKMPPDGKPALTSEEIGRLRAWIEQGAKWVDDPGQRAEGQETKSTHWAFRAPSRPAVPSVRNPRFAHRNPIDAFILAKLESEKIDPSREADRVTLIRRLSLDLLGLPPTSEEVEAFLRDSRPDAYERLVESLLASPHYGERWGRHWLDAARYADSDGYEKDKPRPVWPYRDWVIHALNRDLPYDRFIIEQIAGDLLPNPTQDQRVATGYLRNSMVNEEGGIDPEQFRVEALVDRMDAIGKGVLGLTVQCAQCHDHKYDPLTQEDYYRTFAFLNNDHEANVPVYSPEEQRKRAELFREINAIEDDLRHRHPDWRERMAKWEDGVRGDQPEWVVIRPEVDVTTTGGQKYIPLEDGSFLAQGYAPTKHNVKLTVKTDVKAITAFRLELLTDPNLPLGGPGRAIKGTAALSEFRVEAAPADDPKKVEKVKLVRATADFNPPEAPLEPIFDDKSGKRRVTGRVAFAIDGKDDTAWGTDAGPGRRNQPRKAVFDAEKPIDHANGTVLTFTLAQRHGGWNSDDNQSHNLGRFRLSITTAPEAVADPLPQPVRGVLSIPGDRRTSRQTGTVFNYWRTTVPEWKEANERIEALWRQHPEGSSQLVLTAREKPRQSHVLVRGDFLRPGKPVEPGVPAFLHPLPPGAPPNRLTLAKWLVDRNSPTTARSIVNRVWQAYFGTGLVSTSEDLGTQGEAPSHPELLDYLAVEFMDHGWSLKALHKLIVTSATYRQSSKVTPDLLARDPANRLLARGPRFRVEAEVVRDVALAAGGLLDPTVGGPSVNPPAPAFLFVPPASYGPKVWKEDTGSGRYRRSLYVFRYRSVPYPALQAFDAPNGDFACVRRTRSNTPLQALTTLNEPVFLDCARALALRTVRAGGATDADRLTFAFRRCVARTPTEREVAVLLSLLAKQTERFGKDGAKPWELACADPAHPPELPPGVDAPQLAAWTVVSRVLLNLDETITKE